MTSFEIKYFDGLSSKINEGILSFHPNYWEIKLNSLDENAIEPILWKIENIQKSEFVGSVNIFKYGDYPQQTLECNDAEFVENLMKYYPNSTFFKKEYFWALNKGMGVFLGIMLVIVLFIVGFYNYALPPLAERVAMTIPQKYEIKWGNEIFENMIQPSKNMDFALDRNDSLSKFANDFIKQLDLKTDYPIKITVANDDVINAFALPGGNIVVYNGLLKKLKNKEEFAALLGHEIAHVKKKHSLRNLFKNLAGYLFISLITTDVNGIATILIQNGNEIKNLSFSRELESEADANSMQFLKDNKFNTKGLYQLMKVLEAESKSKESKLLEVLSSHPLTKDRMKFASQNQLKNEIVFENPALDSIWKKIKEFKN